MKPLTVATVMTAPLVTLDLSDTLDVVEDIMTLGTIRHIPITSHGKLVGVVSQRDLLRASLSSLVGPKATHRQFLSTIRVREVAMPEPIVVGPDELVTRAAEIMAKKKIGCLPVVQDGKLLGIVTETDLLVWLARLDTSTLSKHLDEDRPL